MGLFTQATSGVEEPFFRMIGVLLGLKSRMAALIPILCVGALHQQTIPAICVARSGMAGFFLRLLRLDDNRPCAKLIDGTVSPLWLRP
jgi:hypothetical protein